MKRFKFPSQTESEIHQTLGAEKIEEICDSHRLRDEGKELLGRVLLSLKLNDLTAENGNLAAAIIDRIAAGRPEKEIIRKIVGAIAELFIFSEEIFFNSSKGKLKRSLGLECQAAY